MEIEYLKSAIEKLYVKEGRSPKYISDLFSIDMSELKSKLKEWNFIKGGKVHLTPSVIKFFNKQKQYILNSLKDNMSLDNISSNLHKTSEELQSYIQTDKQVKQAYTEYLYRNKLENNISTKHNISREYYIYNDQYRFKTVAALSRFLNKSETQVRRYLENPDRYNIQIINK